LNALDGIFTAHGRILIMTTNHVDFLDDALIRPGRCDHKLLFSNCDRNQIREIYRLYFDTDPEENILSVVENMKYSPAQVTTTFQIYRNSPETALKNLLLVSP
jgi:chaperone BCS1